MAFRLSAPTPASFTRPFTLPFFSHNHIKAPERFSRRLPNLPPLQVTAPPKPTPAAEGEWQELPTTVDDAVSPEIEDADESSKFTWRDHWYPVSLVEDLDPRKPTHFQLLNRDIVLWFDKRSNEWVAFDDKCPHRLAPLSVRSGLKFRTDFSILGVLWWTGFDFFWSFFFFLKEGRIDENGDLQCSYHGWSFDGCGLCTRIPQAKSDGPEARAVKSPRACATRFPTKVSQGLLFVWPDEDGWERASVRDPPRYS